MLETGQVDVVCNFAVEEIHDHRLELNVKRMCVEQVTRELEERLLANRRLGGLLQTAG